MGDNSRLDRIDINILAQLQADSGMTNVRLADIVGLSPSACLQRVRRLEKAGLIRGYRAQIARIDNRQEMHLVSRGYDYLLKFLLRNIIHCQDIITDVLEKNIGVERYFSYVVIQTLLDRSHVPLNR